jgi:hypothetical protein
MKMNLILKRLFFFSVCGIAFCIKAQNTIGILPNPVMIIETHQTTENMHLEDINDTSIINIHLYNPINEEKYPNIFLSNLGQAYKSLVFNDFRQIGYQPGFRQLDKYFIQSSEIKYFRTKTPFTELSYAFGQKLEQIFEGTHSQNIKKQNNIAFNYKRINSDGEFAQHKTSGNFVALNDWFSSKNGKYDLFAAFVLNNFKNQENGGWAIQDVFKDPAYKKDRAIIPVNLEDALNKCSQKNIHLKQYFNPFKNSGLDTLSPFDYKAPKLFTHSFTWQNQKMEYTDTEFDSTFYENYHYNLTFAQDNTKFNKISNAFSFLANSDSSSSFSFNYDAQIQYDFIQYQQYEFNNTVHQLILSGNFLSNFNTQKNKLQASAAISLTPNYMGDFEVLLNYGLFQKSDRPLNIVIKLQNASPTQKESFYTSNHFKWDLQLKKVFTNTVEANYLFKKWDFEIEFKNHLVKNYIFYGENQLPQQLDKLLVATQLYARKDFDWKLFHLSIKAIGQISNQKESVRLPSFWQKTTLYYQGGFIKGRLKAQMGFDLVYNTNYKANNYNPALMEFYVQNQEKIAFYPVLDVFFNIQIKRARVFFLSQHLTSGLGKGGYYVAPNYAMPDRSIKAGVVWQFFD